MKSIICKLMFVIVLAALLVSALVVVSLPFCIPFGVTLSLTIEGVCLTLVSFGLLFYVIANGNSGFNFIGYDELTEKQNITAVILLVVFVFYILTSISLA